MAPTVPTAIVGIVAVVVAFRTLAYNRRKDERQRQQSIDDDFWLRKVVSPMSIEPFLSYASQLIQDLPAASTASHADVQAFWAGNVIKVQQFVRTFKVFGLINSKLDTQAAAHVEKIEDSLAVYCGGLRKSLDDPTVQPPSRGEAADRILGDAIAFVQLVKDHQLAVGAHSSSDVAPKFWKWRWRKGP